MQNLLLRARAGVLAPAMELGLYYYAFGKPKEVLKIEDLDRLPFQIVLVGPRRDPLAIKAAEPESGEE